MGKAIYQPSGRAAEYSKYAVNFYNGCSADCEYCYCKKGPTGSLWSTTPTLKKTLVGDITAFDIFRKEVIKDKLELQKHGLFFNFNSDPFLRETINLNLRAMQFCWDMNIPVKALTKQVWWINDFEIPSNVSIGFTLTGHDELEPGAATNQERIEAMKYLYERRHKIWVSIEPVIDFQSSLNMMFKTFMYVRHFKIGVLSGCKYPELKVKEFVDIVNGCVKQRSFATVYWKDSLLEQAGINREDLPGFCVDRDYRWWM